MMKEKLEDSINKFINGFVGVQNDHYSNWLSEKLWQGVLKQQQGQAISVDIREPKPIHLLDKPRTSLLAKHGGQRVPKIDPKSQKDDWQSYRNVQELRAAGIYLKRSKNDSLSLSDIF